MQTVRRAFSSVVVPPATPRRLAAFVTAVALAAPIYTVSVTLAQANEVPVVLVRADVPADPVAALSQAQAQLKAGQYEEALTALQAIKPEGLSEADAKALATATAEAQQATQMRRAARADFEMGQKALDGGDSVTAQQSFKNVTSNMYADEGTKAKANEQLVLAAAGAKGSDTDWRAMYDEAVNDYKAGNVTAAKPKFVALQNAGYKAPWFSKSPHDYVEAIDKNAAGPGDEAQARAAYLTARDQYRRGDWIMARQNFGKAQQMGYKPGFFEDEPAKYLTRMDKKEQADAAMAAKTAVGRGDTRTMAMADAAQQPAADGMTAAPATQPDATPPATMATPSTPGEQLQANVQQLEAERQSKKYQSAQLTQNAKTAADNQRYQEALSLYTQAAQLDPDNQEAAAGRTRMQTNVVGNPIQENPATQLEREVLSRRDAILFSFNLAINQAREQTSRGEFDAARTSVEQAAAASRSDPGIFRNEELQSFNTQIADARTNIERSTVADRDRKAAEAERNAADAAAQRERDTVAAKEKAVSSLIADSRRLSDQGRYEEALAVVNQVLILDPRNDYASNVRAILFDRASLAKQAKTRKAYDDNMVLQLNDARSKEIPYADVMTYANDWPDLVARRDQTIRDERSESSADAAVNLLLDKQLPEIRFDNVAFNDVIDFLRDTTQANIFVNWKALEAAGIDRNTPVSVRLRNVRLSKVLKTILDNVGGGATVSLQYTVDEGVITISTADELAKNTETRTYDIRDLILRVQDFDNAPELTLQNSNSGSRSGGGGGGGGGGGNNLFGGGGGGGNGNSNNQQSREELVDAITQLIRDTIGQGTWKEDGGSQGSLRELGGQLIVTQTPEVHRQITGLLQKLREQRSIQVMVEARFLTVQKNFLEDVGIDFDFYFNFDGNPFAGVVPGGTIGPNVQTVATTNSLGTPLPAANGGVSSGSAGNVRSGVTNAGIDPTTGLPVAGNPGVVRTGVAPIGVVQNSSSFNIPSSLNTGVTGNLGAQFPTPNLATQVNAFLDDFQASLFFRATQGNQNVTQLTAPRLTLFNGQQAYLAVTTDTNYVSDLTPVVGQSAIGFDPTVDTLPTGVVLNVRATVSADRKYVTLELYPQLSRLLGIDSFPVTAQTNATNQIVTTPDTTTGDNNGTITAPNVTSSNSVGYIQLPRIQRTVLRTTVSVPDGGTLLLGGTTITGEIEREAGVPVLSKIPFLKRAFTNRSSARDESVLLILVKPTIIIQREIEQQNFPLLTNRSGG